VVRAARMLAIAATVVAIVTACGSSPTPNGPTPNGPTPKGPTPQVWAGQVCAALTPWRAQIADLNTRAQQQMSAASTPAETQANLLRLLAGGESASETARAAVVAAGTPDVDGGAEVASRFAASLGQARDAYAHAKTDLAALSTHDPAVFYDGVAKVLATLTTEYGRSAVDTTSLDSVPLRNAFEKVDRCQ
jgi:hypothetical protein